MLCCIQDSKALSTRKSQLNLADKSVNILRPVLGSETPCTFYNWHLFILGRLCIIQV